MSDHHFKVILAVDSRNGLGREGKLVWNIPPDMKRFRTMTTRREKPTDAPNLVIMGRLTFESMGGKPLGNRINVVITRNCDAHQLAQADAQAIAPSRTQLHFVSSIQSALGFAADCKRTNQISETWVIGGAQIYNVMMHMANCDEIHCTEIDYDYICDTHAVFPTKMQKIDGEWEQYCDIRFKYVTYVQPVGIKKAPTTYKFIVLEGIDHSGKTTQCAAVAAKLHKLGLPATTIRYPDRTTPIGKLISECLSGKAIGGVATDHDRALHLLFSANRWETNEAVKRALATGYVICDRYIYSGLAYMMAKGHDPVWSATQDNGLLLPNMVIQIDLNPEIASARTTYGNEVFENVPFQQKVVTAYDDIQTCLMDGLLQPVPWHKVNGELPANELTERIVELIFRT